MPRTLAILLTAWRTDPDAAADADALALRKFGRWCQRWSPSVSVEISAPHPPALLLDITGCAHLFGGEERFLRRVARTLRDRAIRCAVAIGPTPRAALIACVPGDDHAVHLEHPIIPEDRHAIHAALANRPITALRLDAATTEALHEVHLHRIGDLLVVPRADLATRFGPLLLRTLDRMDGSHWEPFQPIRDQPPPMALMELDGPDTRADSFDRMVDMVLADLCRQLQALHRRVREIEVRVKRNAMDTGVVRLVLAGASDDPVHLHQLLRPQLEQLSVGMGVEALCIRAIRTTRADDPQENKTTDLLTARLGRLQVLRVRPTTRWAPEASWKLVPTDAPAARAPHPHPHTPPPWRPTVLLDRAESISVTLVDTSLQRLRWRGHSMAIARAIGPERVSREWWSRGRGIDATHAAQCSRDLWRVQTDDGSWLLLEHMVGMWRLRGVWS
ncbi:MAG: DNA polymerase Y family protein [Planctomycetota bacterium]|nr:DNA polymerase Y family protein [Planctomycetota bacterium]